MKVSMQPTSLDIWNTKYALKGKDGVAIETTIEQTFRRVAKALAKSELDPEAAEAEFYWALENGAIPAGRIMSNVGAEEQKPNTSTINCTVSATIEDSMLGIMNTVKEAGLTLAAGCGIGYDFSTLRPKGAFVAGVGAYTSGALSFMNIYDAMCFTVASAGGRRGAQMATMDICHPDVEQFITAKREDGRLRQFNMSLLITDEFMEAVKSDGDWRLTFPLNMKEPTLDVTTEVKPWPYVGSNMLEAPSTPPDPRNVVHKVYKTVKARDLWDSIMKSTYNFAEPGFILIDKVNRENTLWFCENIRTTNPCGEQPLPPHGACLLGSINLTKFVENAFTKEASFDFMKFSNVVRIFTRMLDNVVEMNGLPLPEQVAEIKRKRRHGMGFLGLGSAMAMLRMKYGSPKSLEFAGKVTKILATTGWKEGVKLAIKKGPAPIMEETFPAYGNMTGKELLANSEYLIRCMSNEVLADIRKYGSRFTHHTSIAPTGTISLSFGNNASNGIEPSFAHEYNRNLIVEGKATKEQVKVYSYEAWLWKKLYPQLPYPDYFSTADTIAPEDHIKVQAAVQPWIDSAISKTINVPTDCPFEDFKNLYMQAYESGLKGCTTFRFNPEAFQGVLVTDKNLAETVYQFTLENGEVVELRGDEDVEYDGAIHKAANLFDAIKEGYYGKL